jgi:hypothetical protein
MTSQTSDTSSDVAFRILNAAWKYMIVDVIFMVQSVLLITDGFNLLNSDEVKVPVIDFFTFLPYAKEQNCSNAKSVMLLDRLFPNDTGESNHKENNLFPKRNIANIYGCPVKVITYHSPPVIVDISSDGIANCTGLEINILSFILESLNATVVFEVVPPKNESYLTTYAMLIEGLESRSADVALGALPLHEMLYGRSDTTVPYFHTHLRWIVPCPRAIPRWGAMFNVFPLPVWLCIFLCLVLVAIILWLLSSHSEHFNYTSLQYCLLSVWAVVLVTSVPKKPEALRVRLTFLLWVWVSFALCMVFQAFFTTYLVNPGSERKIKTWDDLIRSEIKYGYTEEYRHTPHYTDTNENLIKCVDMYVCLEYAIKYGNFATVSTDFHTDYYRANLSWHESHLPVCAIDEDIMVVSIAMYLKKGYPLLQRINEAAIKMVESGMTEKWRNEFVYTSRLHRILGVDNEHKREEESWNSDYFVFSLTHLGSAYLVLMLGYALSVVTVFIELIHCKIHCRNSVPKAERPKRGGHFKRRLQNNIHRFSRHR